MRPSSSLRERLLRRTHETLARLGRQQSARRRSGPPRPGDLFVFRETADFDLQWLVVDRRPPSGGRCLVVPADLHPMMGSADVRVAAAAPCGALTLRCRFAVWLGEETFDTDMRTGYVPPEPLEQARMKLAELARRSGNGALRRHATDDEPEYRSWADEVLTKARAALAGLAATRRRQADV